MKSIEVAIYDNQNNEVDRMYMDSDYDDIEAAALKIFLENQYDNLSEEDLEIIGNPTQEEFIEGNDIYYACLVSELEADDSAINDDDFEYHCRMLHLRDLYYMEPADLTAEELKDLKNSGYLDKEEN